MNPEEPDTGIPTPDDCDWLARFSQQSGLKSAMAAIKFNDQPYPPAVWIDALTAATTANPARAAEYNDLLTRVRAVVPQ